MPQKNGSYKANIMINRKNIHIGYFITYDKALAEYNKAKQNKVNGLGRKLNPKIK